MSTTTSTPPPVLKLSTRVSVAAGNGTIKFVGPTAFAPGKWVGIELDELKGKNDGSVGGKRYFTCEMGKGMFVKTSMIRVLVDQEGGRVGGGEEEEREVSPTPSRPSLSRASISRPISSTASRPLSSSASRPSSSTSTSTNATRPISRPSLSSASSSTIVRPLSVSGRSSVTSSSTGASSPALIRSTSKVGGRTSMAVEPPPTTTTGRLSRASITPSPKIPSSSSTTGTRPRASIIPPSSSSSSSSTSAIIVPRSKSISGAMLPPPPPSTLLRSLSRPISPIKKPVSPPPSALRPRSITPSSESNSRRNSIITTNNNNFAPSSSPSIGTGGTGIGTPSRSLVRPRNLSIVSNGSNSNSGIGLGLGRLMSPVGSITSIGLRRPNSSMSNRSYDETGSLMDEMSPRITSGGGGTGFNDDLMIGGNGDGLILGGEDSEVEEVQDRFSLKGVEMKKVAEATVSKREHEELLAKLRILEARRADDRERLREVDRLKEESEEWLKVKEKSKIKLIELSHELKELKKQTKELTTERDLFELKFEDLTDQVEISLLDKEMAEEKFEASEHALETATERVAELEVEVQVLRDENARMEGVGDEAIAKGEGLTSSLAYIQLEKQNERLKDTLLRFRDHTSEADAEHRRRIADLEKELDLTSDLQGVFDNTVVEFERAERQIEELKLQLDDAFGAEDMLEELTEKNMTLNDKLDELHAIVEDLEALQELNDELEESHLETEKQMQEEIDLKESQLREQQRRIDTLDESAVDYESTIGQFRELVLSLQGDLEQLKEHQASQQNVSQSLNSQSQAMLNLNLKLQSTVAKGQVKTIDLELKKLDALQAADQIAIMKPYLLPAYFEDDNDAVDALLFFERIGYKVDLISMIIEQTNSVTDSLNSVVPEDLVGICETRSKLSKYSALNKRFAAQLKRCSPDLFVKMGRVYHEVSATEKRIDSLIDSLRREEFRETECSRELEGLIAQGGHLAETHLQESLLDLAERELAHVVALELDFDTIAASVGFTKQALATILRDPDVTIEGGEEDLDEALFKPLQDLVNQARNSKVVAKKLLRRMNELLDSSSALSIEHLQGFETLSHNSSAIAIATSKLASSISQYCTSLRSTKDTFQLPFIISLAQGITSSEFDKSSGRPFSDIGALLLQLGANLGTTLASSLENEGVVLLAYTPPWIERVKDLQSNAAVNLDSERKFVKLNEDMKELVRDMRTKDQSYQESSVKIELMEKRMESVKKQAEAILELESELSKSKKQERAYEEAIEALQGDLDTMEQEINKLKVVISTSDKQGASNKLAGEGESISYEGNMETSRLIEQIESLRGAVRFLRSENSYLKSQDLLLELDQLPSYSLPPLPPSPTKSTGIPLTASSFLPTDPSIIQRNFVTESKLLLREARVLSATPRMIDLSLVRPGGKSVGWKSRSRDPNSQWEVEKDRVRDLSRRVERLKEMRLGGGNGLRVIGA